MDHDLFERTHSRPVDPPPVSKAQATFDRAAVFHESARLAMQPAFPGAASVAVPNSAAIAEFAFATELYLKALLAWSERPVEQLQPFEILFKALPGEIQGLVKDHYSDLSNRGPRRFEADLQAFGDSFHGRRYGFEFSEKRVDLVALQAFAEALRLTFEDLEPA